MNITAFSRRYLEKNSSVLLKFMENELTAAQKCYIIMYYKDQKTIREIAGECGVCPSTVSRTISRGTARLQKAIENARELCG
jgi:RNA polymerase sigma factor (sigma-70 family)